MLAPKTMAPQKSTGKKRLVVGGTSWLFLPAQAERQRRGASNLPDRQVLIERFERMVLLRRFETVAQMACRKGETPGFLHLYIGEEATGVGICAHLRRTDWVTSTHRGHGHALAKGGDPKRIMAELFERPMDLRRPRRHDASLRQVHRLVRDKRQSSPPVSASDGGGMSARQQGRDDIGVSFFGDGASNHGGFHETLNFAAVQRAPVVFVCENNLYATATPLDTVTLNTDIASKAASMACRASQSTATMSSRSGWR